MANAVPLPLVLSQIRTTVLGSILIVELLSADERKSSVCMSSTFFSSPFANCIKDPRLKLFDTELPAQLLLFVTGVVIIVVVVVVVVTGGGRCGCGCGGDGVDSVGLVRPVAIPLL